MQKVSKFDTVATIWGIADTSVKVGSGASGTAVETVDVNGEFDGTIVYFPGQRADEVGTILKDTVEEETHQVAPVYRKGDRFYNDEYDSEAMLVQIDYDAFALIDLATGNRLTAPRVFYGAAANGLTQEEFDILSNSYSLERIEEE